MIMNGQQKFISVILILIAPCHKSPLQPCSGHQVNIYCYHVLVGKQTTSQNITALYLYNAIIMQFMSQLLKERKEKHT